MNSVVSAALSSDLSLSPSQQRRLTEILDQYLVDLEQGLPPQPDELVAKHPELAEPLRSYLSGLDLLHQACAGFSSPVRTSSDVDGTNGGKRLGDFAILGEIGRGGMGVVYEARQISLDRRVALKILPFAAVLDPKHIARFKNEAQAAAQIQHPNIVPVFAVGSERGVHYYAMQFVDGQPLDQAIRQLRCPSSTQRAGSTPHSLKDPEYFRSVARLGIQAAEALHAAHEYGVVHRDVKPSNLLVDDHGKLWVTDFGLARVQTDVSLTKTGDVIGTMRYMSPEQALGNSALIDERTDIYSLGATLYELTTLHAVYPGEDHATLLRQIDRQEARRPRSLSPNVPVDLENIVLKAISHARDQRYPTAHELAADLRRFIEGKPTIAKPPALWDRAHKWSRRHRRAVVSGVAVALLATIGLVISTALVTVANANKEIALTEAKDALRHARTRYAETRKAVDVFGAVLAERLADVPGAQAVRKELLEDTLQYYQTFINDLELDPSLRPDLAMTLTKVGTINGQIGSKQEAINAYQRARELFQRLVDEEPDSSDHRGYLALCHNNLGLLLAETGRIQSARQALASARGMQQRLIEELPQETKFVRQLALSCTNVGWFHHRTGDFANAEQAFLAAIHCQQQIAETDPGDAKNLRNLSASYNNLSQACSHGDITKAMQFARDSLRIQQALCDAHPHDREYQSNLALGYNNLGALQSRQGQLDQAIESYDRSIATHQQLAVDSPMVQAYRHDLAIAYNNLGLVQSKQRSAPAAEASFRQALTIQADLVRENPEDLGYLSSIGGIHNNLAMILEQLDRDQQAALNYAEAIDYQQKAYKRAPQITRFRQFLNKTIDNYAQVLRRLNRTDKALEIQRLRPDLAEAGHETVTDRAAKQTRKNTDTID